MKIGIDVDGTVYHWTRAVNEAVEAKFGVSGLTEHTHWDYLKDTLDPEQWRWVWSEDAAKAVFGRPELVYSGATDAINDLCKEHEVHFVTHRNPGSVAGLTGHWLSRHFSGYAGVHVLGNQAPKSAFGHWDVFIDDKPDTIEEFQTETTSLVLVPARPWNASVSATRFESWAQVSDLLEINAPV